MFLALTWKYGKSMKKFLLALPLSIFLSACGAPSVEDLVEDPELFSQVTKECKQLMMQGKDAQIEKCENAQQAGVKMAENMMKAMVKKLTE